MLNSLKKWALVATVFGGTLFASGCLGLGGQNVWTWLAILQEDVFG